MERCECAEGGRGSGRRLVARSQIVIHGDLEVHEFGSFCIIDAGHVNVRTRERRGDVLNIEEKETGLGAVGLDSSGFEERAIDLILLFLAHGALYLLMWNRERNCRIGSCFGIREPAVDIVGRGRSELRIVRSGEGHLHIGDRYGLRTLVGDDKKYGQKSVFPEIDGKEFGLVGSVVWVGSDGNLFVGVVVVRGVGVCRVGLRFGEVFGGEAGRKCGYEP